MAKPPNVTGPRKKFSASPLPRLDGPAVMLFRLLFTTALASALSKALPQRRRRLNLVCDTRRTQERIRGTPRRNLPRTKCPSPTQPSLCDYKVWDVQLQNSNSRRLDTTGLLLGGVRSA